MRAPAYTPVDAELIPTGEVVPVLGTLFDLTAGVRLGNVINSVAGPRPENNGFDHNFVISRYRVMSSSSLTLSTNRKPLYRYRYDVIEEL